MTGKWRKWRVPYNRHYYSDLSDPVRSAVMLVGACDAESAWLYACDVRDRQREEGRTTRNGRRFWMGNIHANAITPA